MVIITNSLTMNLNQHRLELVHPKKKYVDSWRLFVTTNHRCNNRSATEDELHEALDEWMPDGSQYLNGLHSWIHQPIPGYVSKPPTDDDLLSLLEVGENPDRFTLVLLAEEQMIAPQRDRYWKGVLYDTERDRYVLRGAAANRGDRQPTNQRRSVLGERDNWEHYIEHATLGADEEFWIRLKELINQ